MKKILFLLYFHVSLIAYKGLVVVPVADLVGSPIQTFNLAHLSHASYEILPLCGSTKSSSSGCPRLQQLVFNETVEILDKQGNEYCIAIPHLFYTTATSNKPQNIYWTSIKNIVPYKTLEKSEINISKIPTMPSFKKGENSIDRSNQTIVLLFPWYDSSTNKTYSAGTRFVLAEEPLYEEQYHVFILDWQNQELTTTLVPKTSAFIQKSSSKKEAIRQFVTIIRAWAHHYNGYIPYVWGGSSFIDSCKENCFHQTPASKTKKISVIDRPDCKKTPKSGFDCAGLFSRAAQMAGIPYFFKNTLTLAQHLQPLQPGRKLIEGDLIWIPGHVMAVSDVKNNLLIEARGYSHGFGIVQEIELSKVFKDIATYDQLIDAFLQHKPLERLNKDGVPVETIKTIKLLKIESAWDFAPIKL